MGRTLVIGDLHGNYKGMLQALSRANFNPREDTLISLGDVVDGHSQSFEVVDYLVTNVPNLIAIKGNHDDWFDQWIKTGISPSNWGQGQKATNLSYLHHYNPELPFFTYANKETGQIGEVTLKSNHIPDKHVEFFDKQLPYYIDDKNRLFVHGGFNRHFPIEEQGDILWWDRDLWSQALSFGNISAVEGIKQPKFKMVGDYYEVFIGHTSTQFWKENTPMHAANIWNLDTGGGWHGYVTVMDVDTKEFWQSDDGKTLYPDFKGR